MIWLGEEVADGRTTTDAIEEDLYRHRQELFGEVSIAFFDTTSLYFEGAGGPTLGQFGHSKDYRPHLIFCSFLAVLLRKELFDRLAARRPGDLEWQHIVDDLDELSEIEVEQNGRRALLRTAPGATIDSLCRALGITLPPVFQEIPPAPEPASSCGA